jgi:fatty acid desaturase
MKQLTRRSDLRGFLQTGSLLLIYAATVYASFYFFRQRLWVPMAAACFLHCTLHSFIGMESSVHELSHGTPFKTRWLSEFFYHLFCFLTWNNAVHFRVSHMKHHQYTLHRGLDKEVVLEPIDFTWLDYLSWFTFDAKWFKVIMFPTIAHIFGKADVDFFSWDPLFPAGDKRRKQMCNWARFSFIGHLILLGVFIYFQLWVLILVVTFGYFFATYASRGCVIQQHLGLRSNVPDWRVSCHTVKFGPMMEYLYWHMNYHIEHHMYAAVPFYNLRKLHNTIASDTPEPLKGFLTGIKRIMTIKKQQKQDPDYCFMPTFTSTASPPRITSGN